MEQNTEKKIVPIQVKGKIATLTSDVQLVCGNDDYEVVFDFADGDWGNYNTKTALFVYGDAEPIAKIFDGNVCEGVEIVDADLVLIGVVAGDARTTTSAKVGCLRSIRDAAKGIPKPPESDVYNQIMEKLNDLEIGGGSIDVANVLKEAKAYTDKKVANLIPTEGLAYDLSNDGAYYRCSGIGTATDTDIIIASEYNGLPVNKILNNAFKDSNITSVTIPSSIEQITDYAFQGCSKLKKVNIYTSIDEDGNAVGLELIGNSAFKSCNNLTDISLPDTLESIYPNAFYGCVKLSQIYIPKSVKKIYGSAFMGCVSLVGFYWNTSKIEDDELTFGEGVFYSCCNLNRVNLPPVITKIPIYTYRECESITYVEIPQNVTSIGMGAYQSCHSLTDVVIPNGVVTLGSGAFFNCQGLKTISFPDSVETLENAVVSGNKLEEIRVPFVGLTKGGQFKSMICGEVSTAVPSLKKVIISSACATMAANAFEGVSGVTICCEAESQPEGWAEGWNNGLPVIWGYKSDIALIGDISTALDELHAYAQKLVRGDSE